MCAQKQLYVGIDTTFLVAHTVLEHPDHRQAREQCAHLLKKNYWFALCPTVMDEFIHVVTDARRFEQPLAMEAAIAVSQDWLSSRETVQLFPCDESSRLQLHWMLDHRLGRKRINDTRIASVYHHHGVRKLLTSNARDYSVFDYFEIFGLGA